MKNFPTIKRARFWMTFGQEYLTHLRVIQNIGMARIDEVDYNGVKIVPLQFLKAVLPNPQDLGENYEGETSIGCRIRGLKDGKERRDFHRLPHPRIEGWQGAHLLRLQQLQPPSCLQGNRYAGCQLHHGRTSHDWRHDVPQRHLEEAGRMER